MSCHAVHALEPPVFSSRAREHEKRARARERTSVSTSISGSEKSLRGVKADREQVTVWD